ncbi:uncharacterized protein K452DRAFT_133664 [Aplosporella prunicola CBS 121167]|uniref:Uncharacterized protein n=1 Tax=Aplosporella prunicola CBS 121167 TaxID=1176127 RepID=A0A6A6BP61_9PEZI|nr:uncharacterized protein K452DRAFT_133664 [Aplosporella prunicola CBS 121167]KAF2145014.1 hypothetical protein K452DRAFT_133664 [Aplosporella prunicola CBS 121167]
MHTNFHNALSRTFRQHRASTSGAFTVAAWLAPAVHPSPPRRQLSGSSRHPASAPRDGQGCSKATRNRPAAAYQLRPPGPDTREDPQAWIAKLEPLLPVHLQAADTSRHDTRLKKSKEEYAVDIAAFLSKSRKLSSVDFLTHLGIQQGRWNAVMWIVKTVVEIEISPMGRLEEIDPFSSVSWPGVSYDLDEATENAIVAQGKDTVGPLRYSMDQLNDYKSMSDDGFHYRKGALGQIWKSLANMILIVANDCPATSHLIMSHVLELIAYLHHAGIIPESVYRHESAADPLAPQQPPTLYLLSSKIMAALSDASWRAYEAAAASESKTQAHYTLLGPERPGPRYKMHTPELGPEIWLEFVLWSCLHGGWIGQGAAILEKVTSYKGEQQWSILRRDTTEGESESRSIKWDDVKLLEQLRGTQAGSSDRLRVQRTISSELVTAFVDACVDNVHTGIGSRGLAPEEALRLISRFKAFLHRRKLGLGSMSWESVVVRLLESGGFDIWREPSLVRESLHLIPLHGKESEYLNAPLPRHNLPDAPSYITEGSAIAVGTLHNIIRLYVRRGDAAASLKTFEELQLLTDQTKRRSLQQFFKQLNSPSENTDGYPQIFNSNLFGEDLSTAFPHVPTYILGPVLDVATNSGAFDFGRWLLYSEDLDGPLITEEMYHDSSITPALIRFASEAQDKQLLNKIISVDQDGAEMRSMTFEVLNAMVESQIKQHRWNSVVNAFKTLAADPGYALDAKHVSMLAKQMVILRQQDAVEKDSKKKTALGPAESLFNFILERGYDPGRAATINRIHGMLCVLLSIGPEWHPFCSNYLPDELTGRIEEMVLEDDFARILEGVAGAHGSFKAAGMLKKWCRNAEQTIFTPFSGGVWRLSKVESTRSRILSFSAPEVIDVGSNISLRGYRLPLSFRLLGIIYRKVLQEAKEHSSLTTDGERHVPGSKLLKFCAESLRRLGMDDSDIDRELEGTLSKGIFPWVPQFLASSMKRQSTGIKEDDEGGANDAEE